MLPRFIFLNHFPFANCVPNQTLKPNQVIASMSSIIAAIPFTTDPTYKGIMALVSGGASVFAATWPAMREAQKFKLKVPPKIFEFRFDEY